MLLYQAPVEDTRFILEEVLRIGDYSHLPGFQDLGGELLQAILEESGRLASNVLLPLNRVGDVQGCRRHEDGSVSTPDGFLDAYREYCAGGWLGLAVPEEFGGQGLPYALHVAVAEYMSSANLSLMMYPGLTQAAISAIIAHGSATQQARWLPRLVSGEWSGTMNLTEPQCGTDLGLIRTQARPDGQGAYRITGQKIFISAGEHDLTGNIVHLVLARIDGAPAGTKGLSLFIVPKIQVDANGSLAGPNGVTCSSIEHKMGIHGSATCVMEYEEAEGELLGAENGGLRAMFTMMNEARLGVGLQGLAISEAACQQAAAYARERLQGRALTGPAEKDKPADPIMVHPDIRRILMTLRAFNEGGRALMLSTALQADLARRETDELACQAAQDRVDLLTPVVKGVFTDRGFDHAVMAQQVFGGHGYIEETGMSQLVRDARIAMIYEGTNGIQALDLVGRKLPAHGGRAMKVFLQEVEEFCTAGGEEMAPFLVPLRKGLDDLRGATLWLMQNAVRQPDHAGAGATDYMHLLGLVALGHMWARMAGMALAAPEGEFQRNKLATARFFMQRILPETALRRARIEAGAESTMALPASAF